MATDGNIDLQEQMEGESDSAYMAYIIWRDMPKPRLDIDAYRAYIKEKNRKRGKKASGSKAPPLKPSNSYCSWMDTFKWKERAAAYAAVIKTAIKDEHLFTAREEYNAKIKDLGNRLAKATASSMDVSNSLLEVAKGRLGRVTNTEIEKLRAEGKKADVTKGECDILLSIAKVNESALNSLALARTEWYEILGLKTTIEKLAELNDG
jgi:hypothetical protein